MDDIDQTLIEGAGEETSHSESSTEEPKTVGEVETPDVEATAETPEETQTETIDAPKKGAQARIKELNTRAKLAEEKSKSLEQQLAELTGSVEPSGVPEQYQPQVDLNSGEISLDQYKQDILRTAESLVNLKVKQSETINRINNEAGEAIRKYPQLDPSSDQFDKELSESITEATLAHVKSNPYSASPKKFVDKLMKPFTRAVDKQVGQERETIAKQVSQSAVRPTSVTSAGGKADKEKTIKELEAELGIVY